MCISVQSHQERHICTDVERAVQMCISVEFIKKDTFVQAQKELYKSMSESIKKDTFVQAQKELYKCVSLSEFVKKDTFVQMQKELYKSVSLSNSSRKTHLFRRRKSCTNVYLCQIHQERYIFTDAERAVQFCISVRIHQEGDIGTDAERAVQMCISFRIHQERRICTGAERAVPMCISVEFIKKDKFVQAQKEPYKCVYLSISSRKTHLDRCRKSCTNVDLCRMHKQRYICTGAERAVQMCTSVQIHQERHIGTGVERAVLMCISVEFLKKDTFVQAQKELYK